MDLAQLQRETKSSIELTRNSKGDYQWVIKSYYEEGHEDTALQALERIDSQLRNTYLSE